MCCANEHMFKAYLSLISLMSVNHTDTIVTSLAAFGVAFHWASAQFGFGL